MSLERVTEARLLDDASSNETRTRFYVRAHELGLEDRPDARLMGLLRSAPAPRRTTVVGPSGAGKTSLVMRVLADLGALGEGQSEPSHEILVLRVADSHGAIAEPTEFLRLLLGEIAAQGGRFANVDPALLHRAGADSRTETDSSRDHQLGVDAKFVSYAVDLKGALSAYDFGRNPVHVRQGLEDVVGELRSAGHRPILVIDDTEKFITPGRQGQVDESAISNLYHHGIRALEDFDIDLVVAMHPRFEGIEHVAEVNDRLKMERIEVPLLPACFERPPMAAVLARRLERGGAEDAVEEIIEEAAVDELQVIYHDRASDLRSTLRLAQAAAEHAVDRGAERIETVDIRVVASRSAGRGR